MGAVLRGACCARRLTQAKVGEACGYSVSAVSRIESGKLRLDDLDAVRCGPADRAPAALCVFRTGHDQCRYGGRRLPAGRRRCGAS
ncbi:helix-turn-helix domain-containing protein [Streptomyces sp. NPDC048710]|uniref:helix-turn-helix domain-containing protein n=1 Tax=Streptomyces sp. NPDC048710 TaxID=3365586 RepID=UPI00371AE0E5